MKKLMKILLVLFIIYLAAVAVSTYLGNQEIKTLIDEGVLSSDYSQYDLAMLCEKLDGTIFWGCLSGGVW